MHDPRSGREELRRVRADLRAAQHLISSNADQLRAQVAARQRESARRCALSRSVLSDTHREPGPG